jgi:Uma2 family endonuclease
VSVAPLGPAGVRFEDLPEQAWPRQEIFDGSLHVTPMANMEHQAIVLNLCTALLPAVPKDLMVLPGANVLRRTSTDRLLIPDVLVIERAGFDRTLAAARPEDVYLAVEIISPSSRKTDLKVKKQFYAEWKIGSYWVLDPRSQQIHEFGWRVRADCWLADVDVSDIWPV